LSSAENDFFANFLKKLVKTYAQKARNPLLLEQVYRADFLEVRIIYLKYMTENKYRIECAFQSKMKNAA